MKARRHQLSLVLRGAYTIPKANRGYRGSFATEELQNCAYGDMTNLWTKRIATAFSRLQAVATSGKVRNPIKIHLWKGQFNCRRTKCGVSTQSKRYRHKSDDLIPVHH